MVRSTSPTRTTNVSHSPTAQHGYKLYQLYEAMVGFNMIYKEMDKRQMRTRERTMTTGGKSIGRKGKQARHHDIRYDMITVRQN